MFDWFPGMELLPFTTRTPGCWFAILIHSKSTSDQSSPLIVKSMKRFPFWASSFILAKKLPYRLFVRSSRDWCPMSRRLDEHRYGFMMFWRKHNEKTVSVLIWGSRIRMKITPSALQKLPDDILRHIIGFIPAPPKKKKSVSPSFQKELYRIQKLSLKGKNNMYMRDLEDFLLD